MYHGKEEEKGRRREGRKEGGEEKEKQGRQHMRRQEGRKEEKEKEKEKNLISSHFLCLGWVLAWHMPPLCCTPPPKTNEAENLCYAHTLCTRFLFTQILPHSTAAFSPLHTRLPATKIYHLLSLMVWGWCSAWEGGWNGGKAGRREENQ